ncbi:MAG: hypothetical protein Q8P20_01085 [bacterium]|nr:hypothetical protein [bacterium]
MIEVDLDNIEDLAEILEGTIKELKSIPEGHLYARLMNYFDLGNFTILLGYLKQQNKIKISNNLIEYIKHDK